MNPQVGSLLNQAVQYFQNGNLITAERLIQQVLQMHSKNFDALHILGVIKGLQGHHDEARKLFEKAIQINPQNNFIHFNYAKALSEMDKDEKALQHFQAATRLAPGHIEAWLAYGKSLAKLGKTEEALQRFEQALSHNQNSIEAWTNRGLSLVQLKRFNEAKNSFENALNLNMSLAEVWVYRGNSCLELSDYHEGLQSFNRCLTLDPENIHAHYLRGNALTALREFSSAVEAYDNTIALDSNHAGAYNNRAYAFLELKEFKKAISDFQSTLQLVQDAPYTLGGLAYAKLRIADWSGIGEIIGAIRNGLAFGAKVSSPFPILSIIDEPALQRAGAEIWMKEKYSHIQCNKPALTSIEGRKIRIGYFSADYHEHPVTFLTAELFELHDQNQFEIYAFSLGPHSTGEMRQRLQKAFHQFIECGQSSDAEIAALSRELGIDIAIDLGGLTAGARSGIFANGAAPIQVNYLGYPGTLGSSAYDYIITDRNIIPDADQLFYVEKAVYLPTCFQPNDRQKLVSNHLQNRSDWGLPETGFVFCSFNNTYKINPEVFESWMRILKFVEGSVLWLSEDNPEVSQNLKNEAISQGVDPRRLIFAKRTESMADHLGRQTLADLFLDTWPFNAHTTASDALWAGLPVLTREGKSYASRVAASLLRAVGLDQLIGNSTQAYEDMAIYLGTNPQEAAKLKHLLAENKLTSRLFDTPKYVRSLEDGYRQMLQQKALGFPANSIAAAE